MDGPLRWVPGGMVVRLPVLHLSGRFYTMAVVLLPSPAMEALVTGSAGFIGRHLVEALIGRGYRVTGVDRRSAVPGHGYRHHRLDLAAPTPDLAALAARADLVFHLAARPGVRESSVELSGLRWRDNVAATRNLLEVTPLATRVVVTSSSSVYGGSIVGAPSRESDRLRPRGQYARSKMAMEALCNRRRQLGGRIAVLRPFTIAGEGQRPDMAFSTWLDALRRGEPIRIFGSGERSRDITDVRDAVEGLIRAAQRGVNETVNLGTGRGHRLEEMARALLDVYGRDAEIVTEAASSEEAHSTLADTTRCAQILGFVPQTDLRGLLERQMAATAPARAMVAI
jgi:nucleoside-diphosphate-sugar epimerase